MVPLSEQVKPFFFFPSVAELIIFTGMQGSREGGHLL